MVSYRNLSLDWNNYENLGKKYLKKFRTLLHRFSVSCVGHGWRTN